jgi:tRNA (adenine22-N1)-methyltransferase
MINLSKRLFSVASFIKEGTKLVDIGCDHALLDIYLVMKYPKLKSIAVDVKEGAINQAKANISKYNLTDRIDVRLGDGLDVVSDSEIDTITISGLGCPKIIEILFKDKNKLSNVSNLVIQSNTNYYYLRKAVCKNGYYISGEDIINENDIIYVIIHFEKGNIKYKEKDYLFGPILRKNKSLLYRELLKENLSKKEILYKSIPQKYILKKCLIKIEMLRLKRELK